MPEGMNSKNSPNEEEDLTIFENKSGLAEDLKFLASMPELCDVTFLVGETREPVCGVKAVLAARSRIFHQMFYQQSSSPQKKKETQTKENKLRMFLKRSSEPTLNVQNNSTSAAYTAQNMPHQTIIIEEFEPDVFRQLIEYIHTGCVTLQPRTLLGVMNAADRYGLEELRKSCHGFISCCINVDTVCALLQTADRYVHYKCTKSFLKQVLEFVDEKGNEILNLGSFALLPLHVVRLIFSRKSLVADEFTKFQAALMWTMKYSDMNTDIDWKKLFRDNFLNLIKFHKIPANVLMKEVDPLKVVPNDIIVTALAYQMWRKKLPREQRKIKRYQTKHSLSSRILKLEEGPKIESSLKERVLKSISDQADPSCIDPENPIGGSIGNSSDTIHNNISSPSIEIPLSSNSPVSSLESSDHMSSDGSRTIF